MADIVKLATRPQLDNGELVALLEETLQRARAGEIVGVAIAALLADGNGQALAANCGDQIKLIGAVALLNHKLME